MTENPVTPPDSEDAHAQVHDLLRAHASVRDYVEGDLDDALVERCVATAQCAATSSNVQAYSVLRIRDADRRTRLAELCGGQEQVARAGFFGVVCGDLRRDALLVEDGGGELVANLEAFLLATIDASLFAQNLVVAFESHGLGTCYIGGLRNRIAEVDELLGLPRLVLPLFGLCAGVPASRNATKPRLAVEAVLHEERYPDDDTLRAAAADYDAVLAPHFAARGKPHWTWSGQIARKFAGALRPHLAAHYRAKGVELERE